MAGGVKNGYIDPDGWCEDMKGSDIHRIDRVCLTCEGGVKVKKNILPGKAWTVYGLHDRMLKSLM